jgi:lysophospholipase L1-like esterase
LNWNQKLTTATALFLVTTFPGQLLSQPGSPKDDQTKRQSDAAKLQDDLTKAQAKLDDWAQLKRYAGENSALPAPAPGEARVVFYGDSITDGWGRLPDTGSFFPGKPYINRGIGGQTTPQMLIRFEQDVVHLHPAAVVILAGTNDIAGNTGPSTPQMTEDNFTSMAAIAKQNGIKVILASITPAYSYPWKPGVKPVPTILELNAWLKAYCAKEGFTYLDYYSAMVDEKGAMKPGLAKDGVHPTSAGYAVMGPLAESAIVNALQK